MNTQQSDNWSFLNEMSHSQRAFALAKKLDESVRAGVVGLEENEWNSLKHLLLSTAAYISDN